MVFLDCIEDFAGKLCGRSVMPSQEFRRELGFVSWLGLLWQSSESFRIAFLILLEDLVDKREAILRTSIGNDFLCVVWDAGCLVGIGATSWRQAAMSCTRNLELC